jgi:hypothetical protein
MKQTLTEAFCWTRFGTEAAEPIEDILFRKEQERLRNEGIFLWGIGNAVGPSLKELLQLTDSPQVLFSPIKSPPNQKDIAPPAVVAWTRAVGLNGWPFIIPKHSLVTSRYDPNQARGYHYALVCRSEEPLIPTAAQETLDISHLQNLRTGRPVGASQVTAVVRRIPKESTSSIYDVALRASLVEPFLLRLQQPIQVPQIGIVVKPLVEVMRVNAG